VQAARIAERTPWNAARLDGPAQLLAGSDFPEGVEVFLQELLRSFVGPIQGDTRIDGELSLAMVVDVFDVDSDISQIFRFLVFRRIEAERENDQNEDDRDCAHRFVQLQNGNDGE
jgi:hypothetical protein